MFKDKKLWKRVLRALYIGGRRMTIKEIAQISGLKEKQVHHSLAYLSSNKNVISHRIIEEYPKAGNPPKIILELELNPKRMLFTKNILEASESQGEE